MPLQLSLFHYSATARRKEDVSSSSDSERGSSSPSVSGGIPSCVRRRTLLSSVWVYSIIIQNIKYTCVYTNVCADECMHVCVCTYVRVYAGHEDACDSVRKTYHGEDDFGFKHCEL